MASLAALSNLPTHKTRIKPVSVKTLQKPHYDPENARLAIWPWLPCTVGLDKAHILSQIHYWLQKEDVGYMVEGRKWVYNGYKAWSEQLPWLSVDAIGYHIRELEQDGLVITNVFNNTPTDRRKWYTLDYEALALTTGWNPLGLKFNKSPEPLQDKNLKNPRLDSEELQNRVKKTSDSSIYKDYQTSPKNYAENVCQKNDFVQKTGNSDNQSEVIAQTQESKEEPLTSLSNLNEDKCSVVGTSKQVEIDYYLQGFESQEERDGFYQALLELGKHKSGVRSTAGWANAIIKAINAGEPCIYLDEYRQGIPVGSCEKQEWEIAPGKPYPQFISYLKRKLKTNALTDEQAIAAAHNALRDVNLAKSLWESCKRAIVLAKEEWEKQRELGVSSASLPPELLPEREVPVEEAAEAMHVLQKSSDQVSLPATFGESPLLTSAQPQLPTSEEPAAQPTEQEAAPTESEEETRLKSEIARIRAYLKSKTSFLIDRAKQWLADNPDLAHLVTNGEPKLEDAIARSQ